MNDEIFSMASLSNKILSEVGRVITDLAVEGGYALIAIAMTVITVIAVYFRKSVWPNASWRPQSSTPRWIKITGGTVLFSFVVLLASYGGWGKSVTIEVCGTSGCSRSAVIAVLTDNGPDRLGTAEIHRTDDQGIVETWSVPGQHHYLMLKLEGDKLFYSTVFRNKSLSPLQLKFSPPFLSVSRVECIVDRFIFDEAQVPGNGKPLSDSLQKALRNKDQWYFITGHTDKEGDERYNLNLGMDRARAAANYLESQGVPRHQIIIATGGANFPANRTNSEGFDYGEGEPLDRRVEVLCIPNPYLPPVGP